MNLVAEAVRRFKSVDLIRSQILGLKGLLPRKDRAVEVSTGARLVEEAIEVRNAVRSGNREALIEELGDLLIEVEAFLTAHDIDLEEIVERQRTKQRELGQMEG
ncbi:MazG nucleotide pyrophosphohydrolase domain-containing protein [Methanopyrus kandleri]|uniref:Predicted pyrophosphatase n=1 Tax=Methanopyrus kandleri (strain AV19 / DSM 6324 / JCM 9639 / NBRC 100938) TaxID=190192 RepID=Q8TY54_METKA|nr:MazG nucleotide pyrophosphohydrolase domain-containing protein [Methanopyrus kandleri]AAM01667.1 Predicted pyrophosphatase [Methanopyrus kandleri AV19]